MSIIKCPKCGNQIEDSSRVCKYCNFDGISTYLLKLEKEKGKVKIEQEIQERRERDQRINSSIHISQPTYTPKCPTCGSPDIKKIGNIERAASVGFWGLFSKKINKTFECKNCGYMW